MHNNEKQQAARMVLLARRYSPIAMLITGAILVPLGQAFPDFMWAKAAWPFGVVALFVGMALLKRNAVNPPIARLRESDSPLHSKSK